MRVRVDRRRAIWYEEFHIISPRLCLAQLTKHSAKNSWPQTIVAIAGHTPAYSWE